MANLEQEGSARDAGTDASTLSDKPLAEPEDRAEELVTKHHQD